MTPEEEEKIKIVSELKEFWKLTHEYLTYKWNEIPSIVQSFIKIIIWLFIMEIWTWELLYKTPITWKTFYGIPLLCMIISLGCFYIYHEIKTQWQKLNTIKTNTDKLSE